MPLVFGQVGDCFWSHHHAETSPEQWQAYLVEGQRFLERLASNAHEGVVVTFTWRNTPPHAARRKELAERLYASPRAKLVRAHAVVTDSRRVQLLLSAIDWLVHKPFPEQVFLDPFDALAWLANHHAPLDVRGVVTKVRGLVTQAERDPRFEHHAKPAN